MNEQPAAYGGEEPARMSGSEAVTRWHIGAAPKLDKGDGVVAFTAGDLEAARARVRQTIGFHEATSAALPRAPSTTISVPPYRGKSLIPLLGWLATNRLTNPTGEVAWYLDRRQGPDSVRELLEGQGWVLDKERRGSTVCLRGTPPAIPECPTPRSFVADLGKQQVTLAADYGVFSPDHVDEGTALLLDVALHHPRVETVADVGVGYGPLAIGLVLNGVARSAIGIEVDCLALWLAQQNAAALGVRLDLVCSPDPTATEATPLTVCNIPTHISAEDTRPFMDGLASRADQGALLAVVHASLEARYTRHLIAAGLQVDRHPGPNHVVLQAAGHGG